MQRRDFLSSIAATGIKLFSNQSLLRPSIVGIVDLGNLDSVEHDQNWPVPEIIPVPTYTAGVENPCVSLDGTWQISVGAPSGSSPSTKQDGGSWSDIIVPGQADKQGIAIQRDSSYTYRKQIKIPSDFAKKRVFIRFESVSGVARLSLDGRPLEPHAGGFTIWNREITDLVSGGGSHDLTVEVVDPSAKNWSSGFDYGGICRSVQLIALPSSYLKNCHVQTDIDDRYQDARLRIAVSVEKASEDRCRIELQIEDPAGKSLNGERQIEEVEHGNSQILHVDVPAAAKWDAEHPNLYTLKVLLFVNGVHSETVLKKFGVRKIVVSGNRLLVNGKEVKLRGGGRFDSDPTLGHTLSTEQCETEVRLLKEANLNYIRPACYPASEAYLSACDRWGMYVEGETSVTFTRGAESDPKLTALFMNQIASMIEANIDHPCILHWSLGNESNYGINIAKTFEYTRRADPSRPILFSWSHVIPVSDPLPFNIFSYHYPNYSDDLSQPGVAVFNGGRLNRPIPEMPVLHDEFAHGPCFDTEELKRDPNVHNFWGESIKIFWEKMYNTPGCLGGSIWAVIDEPASKKRVYEWGMLDLWRRKKPEYWLMKKAYSPVRINEHTIHQPGTNDALNLEVDNWHDHTNLNELKLKWTVAGEQGTIECPSVPPRGRGIVTIPVRNWMGGEDLAIEFSHGERIVDEYRIQIGSRQEHKSTKASAPSVQVHEDSKRFQVVAGKTGLDVTRDTGMVRVVYEGEAVIESGPYFHLIGADLLPWKLDTVHAKRQDDSALVAIDGAYGDIGVAFGIHVSATGDMRIRYTVNSFNITPPQERLVPWNSTCAGGFSEVGISFVLPSSVDRFQWTRTGLYSVYPEDHIGRTSGTAIRTAPGCRVPPGGKPECSWSSEERDFSLFGLADPDGRGTNDFRSMKEYIYFASVKAGEDGKSVIARSDGQTHAVRLEVLGGNQSGQVKLIINDGWNYTNLGLGNFMKKPIEVAPGHSSEVLLSFE